MASEFDAIARIAGRLRRAPAGELWIGDDAAVVWVGGALVAFAADALVAGVHADLGLTSIADLGWKALAVNVSDLAAMGCRATRATVTVSGPPDTDLDGLYDGLAEAATVMGCDIVGGDLTSAPTLVVSVAVIGDASGTPPPVTRGGARPGDIVWLTAPVGGAAADLRNLRDGKPAGTQHARPVPRIEEGIAARAAGATAMIDVSDGLGADLGHILDASSVGVEIDHVAVAEGATEQEAVAGGDDYELIVCAPAAVELPFIRIGTIVADSTRRSLPAAGWVHPIG